MRHCYYLSSTYGKGVEVQTPERNLSQGYSKLATDLKSNLRLYSRALITLSQGSKNPVYSPVKGGSLMTSPPVSPSVLPYLPNAQKRFWELALLLFSPVQLFVTPRTAAYQASLSFTISQSLLKFVSTELVMSSHPLSSPSPPALNLSQYQGLFQ